MSWCHMGMDIREYQRPKGNARDAIRHHYQWGGGTSSLEEPKQKTVAVIIELSKATGTARD